MSNESSSATLRAHLSHRDALGFLAATTAVNCSNFGFHIIVSRALGPTSYGAVSALLNVVTVVSIPLAALQAAVVQEVAAHGRSGHPSMRRLFGGTVVAATLVTIALAALSPSIAGFLALGSILPVLILALWITPAIAAPVLAGAHIGQVRFRPVAIATISGAVLRLVLTAIFAAAGVGLEGPLIATVFGAGLTLGLLVLTMRPHLQRYGQYLRRPVRISRATLAWTLGALGGLSAVIGLDTVLARHLFPGPVAGRYAAAATAAHMAFFLPSAVATVVFPRFLSEQDSPTARRELAHVCSIVAGIGLAAAAAIGIFPNLTMGLLFGGRFENVTPELQLLGVQSALIGVIALLTYYHLARRSRAAFVPFAAIAAVIGVSLVGRPSPAGLATLMLVACAVSATAMGLTAPAPAGARQAHADGAEQEWPDIGRLGEQPQDDLTLVVPYYNPGPRLRSHVIELLDVLRASGTSFEVVAVSDGSTDASDEGLESFGPEVRVVHLPRNMGKGNALRVGFAEGRGRYIGFIDGDGDIPASVLEHFITVMREEHPDIAVGSKRHPKSEVVYPWIRRVYSIGFQLLVRLLLRLDLSDTQTGVKLIRRDVLLRVMPALEQRGFAFDLELLALARRMGYTRIAELPVQIRERITSNISLRRALAIGFEAVALSWRMRVTKSYDQALESSKRAALLSGAGVEVDDVVVPGRQAAPRGLRILICNWRDLAHPGAGGAEVWTHEVATAWSRRGHAVTVFCSSVDDRPSDEVIDGVRYVRRGGRTTVYSAARRFYRRECRGRFDLVIDEVNTRPFGCATWVHDTPVMGVVHQLAREIWFYETPLPLAVVGRFLLERRWLRCLRDIRVVTVSTSSKHSLQDFGLRDVTVVPEGYRPAPTPTCSKEEQPTLCWVGRLSPNKRPDHAIRAFDIVRSSLPDARLWVIGSGPMRERLERSSSTAVQFFGHVDEEQKRTLMAKADVMVATSVREGWGLTVTEAAALGTPTVGYAVPGLVDSINSSGGRLVRPNVEDLGEELVQVVPEVRSKRPVVRPGGVLTWDSVANYVLRASGLAGAPPVVEDVAVGEVTSPPLAGEGIGPDRPFIPTSRGRAEPPPRRRLTNARRSLAALGVLALVATALTSAQASLADGFATTALVAFACAALLALVETRVPRPRRQRGTWLELRGSRFAWRMTTLLIGAGAALVSQQWFNGGGGIAGGDIVPPVGTAWLGRIFASWAWSGSNLGGPVANEANLPWGAVTAVVHALGGSPVLGQRVWYTALFVGAALGALAFLRLLGIGPGASAIGATAYLLNSYVVSNAGTNPVYLAGLVLLVALPALILAVARGRINVLVGAALAVLSVPLLGYVDANPPLVLLVGLGTATAALLGWRLGDGEAARRLRVFLPVAGLLVLGASAYWILPTLAQYHATNNGQLSTVSSWAWTQGRSTMANSFWLNTAWGWSYSVYYPFANAYSHAPLSALRYLLPIAALATLALPGARSWDSAANRRLRLVASFSLIALFLVLLGTGTNLPGSLLFRPLYALPYGWLLREPGRLLMGAGLAFAVLIAVGVDALARGAVTAPLLDLVNVARVRKATTSLAFAGLVVAPGFPLVTGAIVPAARESFPSGHVSVPPYWSEMATTIDGQPGSSAVLTLPLDDFYQMPYRWGYYGADGFIQDLLTRNVLDPVAQGYTPAHGGLLATTNQFSAALRMHQWEAASRLAGVLGTGYVLVRGDVDSSFPGRDIVSPATFDAALRADPQARLVATRGPLQLFAIDGRGDAATTLRRESPVTVQSRSPNLAVLGLLPPGSDLVTRPPSPGLPSVVQVPPVATWHVARSVLFADEKVPANEKVSVASLGSTLAEAPAAHAGKVLKGLKVTKMSPSEVRLRVRVGSSALGSWSKANGGWGPVGDCYISNRAGANLAASYLASGGPSGAGAVRLEANADRACVLRPILANSGTLLISLDARRVSGTPPQICLAIAPNHGCAPLPAVPAGKGWVHFQATATLRPGESATLYLYATVYQANKRTVSDFSNVSVHRIFQAPPALDLITRPSPTQAADKVVWVAPAGSTAQYTTGGADPPSVVDGMLVGWMTPSAGPKPVVRGGSSSALVVGAGLAIASLVLLLGAGVGVFVWERRRKGLA